ncbi:MAG: FKBP-type peptidyl-prolyl cis-trans isomerase [Candidatus Margulisbacteria bacterium]|nr:FKBP-type peptidyl-prolyl cis-trans isomerase [Candidatus Margulisiibacteriota bacterium]
MAGAKQGDTVKLRYFGKVDNITVMDSNKDGKLLEFKLGDKKMLPGIEKAVVGMQSGEKKSFKLFAEEAFGNYRQEMILDIPRQQLPPDMKIEVGAYLQMQQPEGPPAIIRVMAIEDELVKLDTNHPLAGKDIELDIELVEIA